MTVGHVLIASRGVAAGRRKPQVGELVDQDSHHDYQDLGALLACRAAVVPQDPELRGRGHLTGPRSGRCGGTGTGQQALLVLAHLRKGETAYQGSQSGSQRQQASGNTGQPPVTIGAGKFPVGRHRPTSRDTREMTSKQRVAGSNSARRAFGTELPSLIIRRAPETLGLSCGLAESTTITSRPPAGRWRARGRRPSTPVVRR